MSFSAEIKEELVNHLSASRHCRIAETAAILQYGAGIGQGEKGVTALSIRTENAAVARKYFTLLKKTFNISTDMIRYESVRQGKVNVYIISLLDAEDTLKVLQAVKIYDAAGKRVSFGSDTDSVLLKSICCRRAFLRGAYLGAGSMSDPEKAYHLEFVCEKPEQADQLREILKGFEIEAKIIVRKKYYVVYIKEGSAIVDLLNIMEAHVSLMRLENLRIVKEMRNSINRRVNCEAANITKTVNASARQTEAILFLRDSFGLDRLPPNLREMAELRLEFPEASLKELGNAADPPVGKSGVNHRLRKLSELAGEQGFGNE